MADTAPRNSRTIQGTSGDDVLRVESSVTFDWVPDSGDSRTEEWTSSGPSFDPETGEVEIVTNRGTESGPGRAWGFLVFEGVSSSESFTAAPGDFAYGLDYDGMTEGGEWSWDPAAGVLDGSAGPSWGTYGPLRWTGTTVDSYASRWGSITIDVTETGHWRLRADPGEATATGGFGDDTIYGGQGSGSLNGGNGDDRLHGDFGDQTLFGASGSDTIWGGSGDQILLGGSGGDVLHAGRGDQTLHGGSGDDVFVFGSGGRGSIVVKDLRAGHDVVSVARGINGLAVDTVSDLVARVTADGKGDALLDLGAGETVTLARVAAQAVAANPDIYLVVA